MLNLSVIKSIWQILSLTWILTFDLFKGIVCLLTKQGTGFKVFCTVCQGKIFYGKMYIWSIVIRWKMN